jgi:hypothetical protein
MTGNWISHSRFAPVTLEPYGILSETA